jgi:AcrR family transcriptional regulator
LPARDVQDLIRGYRRDQVVKTALRMFGRSGSLEISMEEIAAEAGVSRSTIYNHFRDRAELLAACADWSYGHLTSAIQKALDGDAPSLELVAGFFEAAFRCLDENPGFYRLATTLRSTTSSAEATLDQELARAATLGLRQIEHLVEQLTTRGDTVVDRELAASFVGVVLAGSLQRRAVTADPPDAQVAAREIAELVLFGLSRD